jgi:hypothetical protein
MGSLPTTGNLTSSSQDIDAVPDLPHRAFMLSLDKPVVFFLQNPAFNA